MPFINHSAGHCEIDPFKKLNVLNLIKLDKIVGDHHHTTQRKRDVCFSQEFTDWEPNGSLDRAVVSGSAGRYQKILFGLFVGWVNGKTNSTRL